MIVSAQQRGWIREQKTRQPRSFVNKILHTRARTALCESEIEGVSFHNSPVILPMHVCVPVCICVLVRVRADELGTKSVS